MDDFISREDTIEKMEEVDWYHQNKNGEMVHGANSAEHQAWYKAEDVYKVLEDMPPAQPERIQNNAVHLCDSCQYTYVTCPSHGNDAVFGDGKGNDNICACNKYRPIFAQPERKKGKWVQKRLNYDNDVWVRWECSRCGYLRKNGWRYILEAKKPEALFCEMCGADMRGDKE